MVSQRKGTSMLWSSNFQNCYDDWWGPPQYANHLRTDVTTQKMNTKSTPLQSFDGLSQFSAQIRKIWSMRAKRKTSGISSWGSRKRTTPYRKLTKTRKQKAVNQNNNNNNAKEKKIFDKASTAVLFCPHIPTCVSNFHLSRSIWQGY